MNKERINIRFGLLTLLIITAAFSRIIPHPPNFAPVGAIAIFGAAYFSSRVSAFIIPIVVMWISDFVLNNTIYSGYYDHLWIFPSGFPWIYFSFIIITMMGFFLLKKINFRNVTVSALSASIIFFLLSNFAVWFGSVVYPQNLLGLITCYIAGIPFFWNTIAGDLVYSTLLFSIFEYAKYRIPKLNIV